MRAGTYIHSEERRKKISMAMFGNRHRLGKKHSSETKKMISIGNIKHYQTKEGKIHIEHILTGRRVRPSKPQKELFEFLKQIFPDAQLEYLVHTRKTFRHLDIAVPSLKIDFEYDGAMWHTDEGYEKERDLELAEIGWITFRADSEVLKKLRLKGSEMFERNVR